MITCEHSVRVRYSETDQMGIVHHSQYLNWLECARIELLDQIEMPYIHLEAAGYGMPVLGLQVQYKRPAKFDDHVVTRISLKEMPSASMELHYQVRCRNTLLATATTRHAFTGPNGQATRPPKQLVSALKKHWNVRPNSA